MIRKCILKCKKGTHNPINLPHNKNVIIGRSKETLIKDKRCSKSQVELLADCEACSVTVRQIGANTTSINGKPLKFGNTAHLEHRDVIEILSGEYLHIIEFDPPPKKLHVHHEENSAQDEKYMKKRKMEAEERETPPKKMERGDEGRKVPSGTKFKIGWSSADEGQLLVYNPDSVQARNKIAAYDMDGTLITTSSGRVFPVDYDDWQIIYAEVPGKLKKLNKEGYKIVIFTNQAGISRGKQTVAGIQQKIQRVIDKLGVPIQAFVATGRSNYRKPLLGMWDYLKDQCNEGVELCIDDCLYVGDAAGRTENVKRKDHSCADRLFAINIGINFYTTEEHFLGVKTQKHNMPEFDPHNVDENTELFEPSTTKVPQFPQEPKKQQGHWSSGLLTSMNDPDLLIEKDDKIVIIKDKYPKARHHFLILPQENIPSLKSVKTSHTSLLKYMDKKANILASKYPDCEFRYGYHAIPSMARMHLHVISQDFDSVCLKTKRHWNSFNTKYFLESTDVIESLEKYGKCDSSEASKELLDEQLKCHKCSFVPQNMPKLKDHLKKHLQS